jgi:hypothetical protein
VPGFDLSTVVPFRERVGKLAPTESQTVKNFVN